VVLKAPRARSVPTRTASGSVGGPTGRARTALASRIYVEGRHDAELVEKIWGDDLRHVGVVVEYLGGIDDLPGIVTDFAPKKGRRLGVHPDMWPSTFNISGMQYEKLETQSRAATIQAEVTQRLRWLRGLAPFDIGAYQQLASLYARHGHRRQAQRILMKGRTRARRADVGASRGWTRLILILLMCF
jgi:hypothetical protein